MLERPASPGAARGAVRLWHPWEAQEQDTSVLGELASAIRHAGASGDPSQAELQMRLGEIRSLIKSAQRGELADGDWDPVRRQPDLWELRWAWQDDSQVRMYFHEPEVLNLQTVAALVHVKRIVPGDRERTRALQNEQMDRAGRRITFGAANDWGLGWSSPIFPDPQPMLVAPSS